MSALNWRWIFRRCQRTHQQYPGASGAGRRDISWLSNPHLAMLAVITVVVWQGTPFFTMSFLAGLQGISQGAL